MGFNKVKQSTTAYTRATPGKQDSLEQEDRLFQDFQLDNSETLHTPKGRVTEEEFNFAEEQPCIQKLDSFYIGSGKMDISGKYIGFGSPRKEESLKMMIGPNGS